RRIPKEFIDDNIKQVYRNSVIKVMKTSPEMFNREDFKNDLELEKIWEKSWYELIKNTYRLEFEKLPDHLKHGEDYELGKERYYKNLLQLNPENMRRIPEEYLQKPEFYNLLKTSWFNYVKYDPKAVLKCPKEFVELPEFRSVVKEQY